jgi:type IV pilus assembly protein PilN
MIKINLVAEVPAASAKKRSRSEFSLGAKQGDILLLTVLGISLVVVGTNWLLLKNTRNDLRETRQQRRVERDELKPFIDKVDELETKRDRLKHKINVINTLKQNQRGPVRIMDEVSRAMPDLVWLTKMDLSGTNLAITGMAMDENAVANYLANIDGSPFFQEPTLKDMARSTGDSFRFTMNCVFTYAPPEIVAAGRSAGS